MARVKRALNAQKKRRTVLKASKGYRGQRSRLYRKAKEQQLHSLTYAYRDRKARKGDFRKLWISRINAAGRANGITYNRLIQGLKAAGVEVDRKNLAEIAVSDPAAFTALVEVAKAALPEDVNAPCRRGRLTPAGKPTADRAFGPRGRGGKAAAPRGPHERRRAARFLAEGPNLVEAASRRGLVVDVFATESALRPIRRPARRHRSFTWSPTRPRRPCPTPSLRSDWSRCARIPEVALADVLARHRGSLLVAVETSEPGNAGTLIRIADAMGADAVVLAGDSVDPYNGKCLRASAGSIFALPVLQAPDVEDLMAALRDAGVRTLATTLDGEQSLARMRTRHAPTAWLFGSEAHGLAPDVAALADARVSIPMRGSAESLNIATAAAICLYQSALAQSGA